MLAFRIVTRGAIFFCALSWLFVFLKAVNIIAWPWWIVLPPAIIAVIVIILICVLIKIAGKVYVQ